MATVSEQQEGLMKPFLPSLLAGLLMGCAVPVGAPYWQQTYAPMNIESIEFVPNIYTHCAKKAGAETLGCMATRDYANAKIYIQAGLTPDRVLCALWHEIGHANGYTHPDVVPPKLNCGPV